MRNNDDNEAGDRDDAEGASGARRRTAPPDDTRAPRLAFPVVGIGASAGGLEAYTELLQAAPVDAGMAYVFVQHVPPDRESLLAELLARQTAMPVVQVVDGQAVEPDHVYVIRPGRTLTIKDGRLWLGPELAARGHGRPVDDFFRSLAEEQQERAVAVVFSGMGSNGSAGAEAVKAVGGLVIAQDPESAGYPSMPRSLIAGHLADLVLRPAELPAALLKYARQPYTSADAGGTANLRDERALADVLAVLRTRTRHDFSGYRKPTLFRRVRRRMGLCELASMAEYVGVLRQTPAEVTALADDLLIHVTGFFRDPEVWVVLRAKVIDPLMQSRADGAEIRCWVSACATGEEAYTLAMLLVEAAEAAGKRFEIKVFATDMAERALGAARTGRFPNGIESEVTPERLARFFDRDDSFYRVKKDLRELVIFAPQNLLQDPPFSRLDIATCRNLLIYLEPETQRRVLSLLHFGLREGGALLLGSSESPAPLGEDFEPIDRRHRLFRRVGPTRSTILDMPASTTIAREVQAVAAPAGRRTSPPAVAQLAGRARLDRSTPPAVVVDAAGQIAHVHGDTARFLTLPPGSPTLELMALAHEQIRGTVRTALRRTIDSGTATALGDGLMDTPDGPRWVEVSVAPLDPRGGAPLYLVTFREFPEPPATPVPTDDDAPAAGALADELQSTRHELQGALAAMQSSHEELRAAHDEATSLNEELQSTNEELETSKEEMQSLNEELVTVNAQLQTKMGELEGTANDLGSLLTSTDIAVLFLDLRFCIRRFTPAVQDLLDLIPPDVGRPFVHMRRKFVDETLMADAQAVLDRLIPIERAIESESGRVYLRRILPYRTRDHRIDGVVIAFVEITERKRADAVLAAVAARDAFRVALADALRPLADPAEVQAAAARVLGEHLGASRVLYAETTADETMDHVVHGDYRAGVPSVAGRHRLTDFGRFVADAFRAGRTVVRRGLDDPSLPPLPPAERAVYEAVAVAAHVGVPLAKGGRLVAFLAVHQATPREWTAEEVALIEETAERTWAAVERARAQATLRASEEEYHALFDRLRLALAAARMGIWTLDVATAMQRRDADLNGLLGLEPVETTQPFTELLTHVHPDDRDRVSAAFAESVRDRRPLSVEFRIVRPDGEVRWLRDQGDVFADASAGRHMAGACVDVTDRRAAEDAVRAAEERLRLILASATDYAILTQDADRTVTSWSSGAAATFGYSETQILGHTVDVLFTPEDRAAGIPAYEFDTARRTGRAEDERWHMREDGSRFYASGVLSRLATGEFVKVARDLTDRKRMEDALRDVRDRLEERVAERTAELAAAVSSLEGEIERRRDLALRLSNAQEDERKRVSRDLHDTVGQTRVALTMALAAAGKAVLADSGAAGPLAYAGKLAESMGRELHDVAMRLRPTALDDLGLAVALRGLVRAWSQQQQQTRVELHAALDERLPDEVETALYRLVQEALTNVARHARATTVTVVVTRQPELVTVVIEDNGVGFDPASAGASRLGLRGMRERVALLGGELDVDSTAGAGTSIIAQVPLRDIRPN